MLYEVVDPYLAWRRLFQLLKTDLEASKPVGDVSPLSFSARSPPRRRLCSLACFLSIWTKSIPLVHFVLETFKAHDEEVRQLHLPIVFAALLELIEVRRPSSTKFHFLLNRLISYTLPVCCRNLAPVTTSLGCSHPRQRNPPPRSGLALCRLTLLVEITSHPIRRLRTSTASCIDLLLARHRPQPASGARLRGLQRSPPLAAVARGDPSDQRARLSQGGWACLFHGHGILAAAGAARSGWQDRGRRRRCRLESRGLVQRRVRTTLHGTFLPKDTFQG